MACCGRSLDSPCTLALLVGFQFAFVLYFSLGGFRGLVSVLVHTTEPEFDYSRPHDVYTNLSHLGVPPPPPRNSSVGAPGTGPPLRDCQIPSPLLGESAVLIHATILQSVSLNTFLPLLLSSSRTCVCPPFLSSVFGGDPTEEPTGVAGRTLPASRLRTPPPHSNSSALSEPADPSACPALPPPPLPAETANPLQHLYRTAGPDVCSLGVIFQLFRCTTSVSQANIGILLV